MKENRKKTPNWSKIQSVRFIGEKMSHKGVGVIAKTTVPAITELVREYVKVEVSESTRFEGGSESDGKSVGG